MSAKPATLDTALDEHPQTDTNEYTQLLDQLKEVEKKYKLGDVDEKVVNADGSISFAFEKTLNDLQKLVDDDEKRFRKAHPAWYYKFIAIQGEAKEYYDTATADYRLDMFTEAQKLYHSLPTQVEPDEHEERIVLKNKIRVIVRGLEHLYSSGDFATAIEYAQQLYNFVISSGLITDNKPAHGTLAIIYNFLGRAYRERGIDNDYQQAIDYFYKCSESYFEMARRREGNQEADVIYARTRAMVSLAFGAGFLFYNSQSDLVRAKALIAQARNAFLRDNSRIACELHYNSLELFYASILRAEAGEIVEPESGDSVVAAEQAAAREKLNWAKRILEECQAALGNKPKYLIHVLFHKALVYTYLGPTHYSEALECLNELLLKCLDNTRWLANSLVVKSHLERRLNHFDVALADAVRAYNLAGNHVPVRIEALLARAQAQMARRQFSVARNDIEKALSLNNEANLKLTAVGNLLLVDVAIAEHKPGLAYEKFREVEKLMPSIRHGYIRTRFRQISDLMDSMQTDFVIPGTASELDYKQLDSELQRWLLQKALREDRNLTHVAKRLNVTKKTIYLWLAKHDIKV
jgi:tetratricopeptide (TPR) repeat protein